MRTATLLLLAAAPLCAASGEAPFVATDQPSYAYLDGAAPEVVIVRFTNPLPVPVDLPNPAPFVIEDARGVVYRPYAPEIVTTVPPSSSYDVEWSFQTNCLGAASPERPACAGLATPGAYTVTWRHFRAPGVIETTSAAFEVRGP